MMERREIDCTVVDHAIAYAEDANPFAIDVATATWGAAKMRFERAKGACDVIWQVFREMLQTDPRHEALGDAVESLCADMFAAERVLMETLAPDLTALRWKLNKVFDQSNADDEYTESWSRKYLVQMFADIGHLMGDAS